MADETLLDQLIPKIQQGDKAAFQEVYESTKTAVYSFALSIVLNRSDAEDIMHDTYLRIYNGAAAYRPMGRPLAWILTIVRNLAYSRMRNTKPANRIQAREEELVNDTFMEHVENRVLLESLLKKLSPDERQIVVLHVLTSWKHREIAEWMGLPVPTVISKYRRALEKMKKEIE